MSVKSGLPPIADPATRLFILGSLPGDRSLAEARYYAFPTNQFWRLLGSVIDVDLPALPYDERLVMLREHRIGLWDVVGAAHRPGSADAGIRNATANDLGGLKRQYPDLRAIAFNGGHAAREGARLLAGTPGVELIALPSSSAANARVPFEAKARAWARLREFIAR